MLTLPRPTQEQSAVMIVAAWYSRLWPGWERFLLALCSLFHLWLAVTLAFAPTAQILNAGTQPVFELAPRGVWAAWFFLAGAAAAALLRWHTKTLQAVTWFSVFPLAFAWLSAFVMAVLDGRGSAIGIVVWSTLTLLWAPVAIRLALGKR
jgi:hypothetical protein